MTYILDDAYESELTEEESNKLLLMCGHAVGPQLSPAAQAVAWAYDNTPEKETNNHRYHWLAAALRAAADQVVPYEATAPWDELKCNYDGDHWEMRQWVRDQLLAIATELEAPPNNSEGAF